MFLLLTSRQIELGGCTTAQIVRNGSAILNLSNFFKIDQVLGEILPSKVVLSVGLNLPFLKISGA